MNIYITLSFILTSVIFSGCSQGQTTTALRVDLTATEFAGKIKEFPASIILDVRTAEEYSKGHLINSVNYDWYEDQFENKVSQLDKTLPVFVYCLSGGRSSDAAKKMRSDGFEEVYELEGGLLKWRSANLPEENNTSVASAGMSSQQFVELLNSDKLVLVDFYADWCAPCRKMEPYLDEIARDMAETVVVIRINADDHPAICKELKIDVLPVLQLYRNATIIWTYSGFIEKGRVVKQLQ